jgi:hypothetical protein
MNGLHQIALEPISCQVGGLFQRTRFFKQVSGSRHNYQALFGFRLHLCQGLLVKINHYCIFTTNDQQYRRLNFWEGGSSQVGPATA